LVAVVGRSSPYRVEPDGGRVKAAILREESFGKTIPTEPRFVDDRRIDRADIGNGNQLHARGHRGVVAREQATTRQCQGEALIGVADVVAPGQKVIPVDVLIQLDDGAVYTIGKWRRYRRVISASVVAIYAWIGGGRPCFPRAEQVLDHRIDS